MSALDNLLYPNTHGTTSPEMWQMARDELAAMRKENDRLEAESLKLFQAVVGVLGDAEHHGYTRMVTLNLCQGAAGMWLATHSKQVTK
jgi:hypothetical protein